jgi:hypothetical protein
MILTTSSSFSAGMGFLLQEVRARPEDPLPERLNPVLCPFLTDVVALKKLHDAERLRGARLPRMTR